MGGAMAAEEAAEPSAGAVAPSLPLLPSSSMSRGQASVSRGGVPGGSTRRAYRGVEYCEYAIDRQAEGRAGNGQQAWQISSASPDDFNRLCTHCAELFSCAKAARVSSSSPRAPSQRWRHVRYHSQVATLSGISNQTVNWRSALPRLEINVVWPWESWPGLTWCHVHLRGS